MCPTPTGRIHTRTATLTLPALLGLILSLITGREDWIVLIGVFLLLGVALDAGVYSWILKYQPPWMTGILALVEFGLLYALAQILELDLRPAEAIIFYWVSWTLATATRIALLPIASLTYLESSGEFRRVEWSIPPQQASIPILADVESPPTPGSLIAAATVGSGSLLEKKPSPSAIHPIDRSASG